MWKKRNHAIQRHKNTPPEYPKTTFVYKDIRGVLQKTGGSIRILLQYRMYHAVLSAYSIFASKAFSYFASSGMRTV